MPEVAAVPAGGAGGHTGLSAASPCLCPLQDEIEQVILVGGATRVPKVQEVLLKAVGK